MKYVFMHDAEGRIAGFIASSDGAPPCVSDLPGYLSSEVDVPSDFPDITAVETEDELRELLGRFRVDVSGARLLRSDP